MTAFILASIFSKWLVFANMQIERSTLFYQESICYDVEDKHLELLNLQDIAVREQKTRPLSPFLFANEEQYYKNQTAKETHCSHNSKLKKEKELKSDHRNRVIASCSW